MFCWKLSPKRKSREKIVREKLLLHAHVGGEILCVSRSVSPVIFCHRMKKKSNWSED